MMTFDIYWNVAGEDDLRGPYYVIAGDAEEAIDRWEELYENKPDEEGRVCYACPNGTGGLFANRLYRVDA